ncbi:L-aspartate oxidase [Verrucomicrobium sp. GAS474]|uniref:L-aspartate oxidase n=1 Tax=Verrucomicrobium sp. GAS474 TaxID=1882831 RepID=UPI00087930B0|nr:L-aspartate oxidase [Verrucomicrobium sp. GAS474]SDU11389.1 L-aspartate oxidase [Verrucomicrobium sp. GAS474]
MTQQFDSLVLGSGIAGLTFALKAAEFGTVAVITKKGSADSNTNYAQGGIACVTSEEDSFGLHIQDTLEAGAGLCREEIVRQIVEEGPERVRELIALGVQFTERRNGTNGELDLGKEGGHSKRRILHAKDVTGREIERALLEAVENSPRITVFENYTAIDFITTKKLGFASGGNRCVGVYALDNEKGRVVTFGSRHIFLATGGCGKVYLYTTNPDIATGDGVAMAYRAGVPVANMEFIQFHPTCLHHPKERNFLITEAVRGEGGVLLDAKGHRFMEGVHPRAELAPRDVVARAIDAEMKRSGSPCVYLDISHKGADFVRDHFPNIYEKCLSLGIDITKEPIPVVPAAHYQCGGVVSDLDGRTSLPGLWVAGEVACTGLHGANRLASNSLLEALVVSHRAAGAIKADPLPVWGGTLPVWESGSASDPDELIVVTHNWREIRQLMWDYVAIVRTTKRLQRAGTRLRNLSEEVREYFWNYKVTADLLELRNLVLVASLIVDSALARKESRGLHYNTDYPALDTSGPPRDTLLVP